MVQGIMELLFDTAYLATAMVVGIYLIVKGKGKYFKLFGIMAVVLASGDAFHLVPRVYALLTTGVEAHAWSLGLGKLITSITMTGFYVILYYIWELKYQPSKKLALGLRIGVISMAVARVVLCCCPNNEWFKFGGSILWGVIRNIPFAIMGIIIIVLCFMQWKKHNDKGYFWMAIMVILSFGFYIPVVLWADKIPLIGMLMIPKTLAYVGVVVIGLLEHKKAVKDSQAAKDNSPSENADDVENIEQK